MGMEKINAPRPNSESDGYSLKESGNQAFQKGNWEAAQEFYSQALKLIDKDDQLKAVVLKNRAAVYLKNREFEKALLDCNSALEIQPNDPKTYYRRCQAYDGLGRHKEAYKDAREVHNLDPTNKTIQPILSRLHETVQQLLRDEATTTNKVSQMFDYMFETGADPEKRENATNNLLVLAKENSGAAEMHKRGIVTKIKNIMKIEKNEAIILNCIRIIGELCRNESRAKDILAMLGYPWFLDALDCRNEERVNATQYCMQRILSTLTGMDIKQQKKPDKDLLERNKVEIDTIFMFLLTNTNSRSISGLARDAIVELLMRMVNNFDDWALKVVETEGLDRLMEVASELPEYKYDSSMEITDSSRTTVSVLLSKVYDGMCYDKARQMFTDKIDAFIKEKLMNPDIESKVRVTVALTTLLLGPLDVGCSFLSREGILEMILVMAGTDDVLQQRVSCEAIIAAASKKSKAKSIVGLGVDILKKLYKSKDDGIKVRALVGLCKLGSCGGTDASIRPFAEGSTLKLAEACRRFLVNPTKDKDMRKWATEGLSYLTLDAEVKEKLIEDRPALNAMIELAKTGDMSVFYGVVATLVNLTNSYDKQEVIPEMLELAKLAKQHIPEEHELDDSDFVEKRIGILAHEGVTSALVSLSKTESKNSKELISRVLNAICENPEHRGIVVQQGGAKVLINMALDGTDKGKVQAAQALARLGITINPEVAFPGQRCCEVVRPLLSLLHPDCSALENFESLMALCNLAGVSETVRKRILKEQGLSRVEHYMFEDHPHLKRAATQVVTNLVISPEVVPIFEGENDKLKYLILLSGEDEDVETSKAAAGAVAMLTSVSKKCCSKVFQIKAWVDILRFLLANPDDDIQHRGLVIVLNMMSSEREVAEKIIETDLMEILMALSQLNLDGKDKIKELATKTLAAAEEWKLIKKPDADASGTANSDEEDQVD